MRNKKNPVDSNESAGYEGYFQDSAHPEIRAGHGWIHWVNTLGTSGRLRLNVDEPTLLGPVVRRILRGLEEHACGSLESRNMDRPIGIAVSVGSLRGADLLRFLEVDEYARSDFGQTCSSQ